MLPWTTRQSVGTGPQNTRHMELGSRWHQWRVVYKSCQQTLTKFPLLGPPCLLAHLQLRIHEDTLLNWWLSKHEILNEGPSPGTVQLRECLLTALLYTARCYGDLKGVTCGDKSVLIVRQKAQCHDLWWQGYFHSVTPPIDGNPPRNHRPRNDRAGSNFKLFEFPPQDANWTLLSNCYSHQFLSYKYQNMKLIIRDDISRVMISGTKAYSESI